jgi:hypothetical protein
MSDSWTQYRPKLALYGILDKGGISVDDAMKRADAAVEGHREKAGAALEAAIEKLEAFARARGAPQHDALYEQSTFVLDIAGIFQPPLFRAAHSLCELTHRMKAAERWDWPAIDVHVGSMRALIGKRDDKDPTVQAVLTGLHAVVARYADPSPPDPPKPAPQPA